MQSKADKTKTFQMSKNQRSDQKPNDQKVDRQISCSFKIDWWWRED